MVNIKRKIIEVTEPKDKRGLYTIKFYEENGDVYTASLTKADYEIVLMEQEFQDKGYDMELIDKYKYAVMSNAWND